ncbi:MAG: hypothetical protein ACRERU_06085 [Methylococcales bacterium]
MQIYNYNSDLREFKDLHDETGGRLKNCEFKYYDCFCGGEQHKIVSTATRHRSHFDIVQCADCGELRINPYLFDASSLPKPFKILDYGCGTDVRNPGRHVHGHGRRMAAAARRQGAIARGRRYS